MGQTPRTRETNNTQPPKKMEGEREEAREPRQPIPNQRVVPLTKGKGINQTIPAGLNDQPTRPPYVQKFLQGPTCHGKGQAREPGTPQQGPNSNHTCISQNCTGHADDLPAFFRNKVSEPIGYTPVTVVNLSDILIFTPQRAHC